MIKQLNPAIPLVTPKGSAEAILVLDYGRESELIFVCIQDETGEVWLWPNNKVRGCKNITLDRENPTSISEIK